MNDHQKGFVIRDLCESNCHLNIAYKTRNMKLVGEQTVGLAHYLSCMMFASRQWTSLKSINLRANVDETVNLNGANMIENAHNDIRQLQRCSYLCAAH